MEIRKVPISEINPAPYNPRVDLKPGDPAYEQLKSSMEQFGYVSPLVWNMRTKTLISGHQRLKLLKEQGCEEVEVSVVDLPLEKEKALNLALNKITGAWDQEKLAVLLDELCKVPEFDFTPTGFDMPEISGILDAQQAAAEEDNFDFDAAIESIIEPVTKRGDLIELGFHRILCGDSSNPDDVNLLMAGCPANLLHTDPPYNVSYLGGNRPNPDTRPKKTRQWERIYSDNLSQDEYEIWLKKILTNAMLHMDKGAPFYIWNGHRQFGPMHLMLTELGAHISSVITWAKPSFAIGYGDYNQQTEFSLYGWLEDNGAHAWYGPTNESTLWQIKRDPTAEYIHPTQKPLALPQRAIRNSSKRGDIVLDLFLGSGSSLIAAQSLERRCFGIEIDPKYVDGIVRRYIAFVGKDQVSEAIRAKYFTEVAHE
jgi:DNA modification methylase